MFSICVICDIPWGPCRLYHSCVGNRGRLVFLLHEILFFLHWSIGGGQRFHTNGSKGLCHWRSLSLGKHFCKFVWNTKITINTTLSSGPCGSFCSYIVPNQLFFSLDWCSASSIHHSNLVCLYKKSVWEGRLFLFTSSIEICVWEKSMSIRSRPLWKATNIWFRMNKIPFIILLIKSSDKYVLRVLVI